MFSGTAGTANEYKKENGVSLLGYNSRYVTHQMTAYITAVAKSDDLTSNSTLSVCESVTSSVLDLPRNI